MIKEKKRIIYIILFSLLVLLFVVLLAFTVDNKKIREISEFVTDDTRILYITENSESDYQSKVLNKYGISYLKINSAELSIFEKKKLKKIIDKNNLKNVMVIFNNGKIVDTLENSMSKDSVNKFLQENNIIPKKLVDNVDKIMTNIENMLNNEYSMIYIPYVEHSDVEKQNEFFEDIAKDFSINYIRIDAYYLSNKQQEKINNILNISLVDDQVLILVKENKMVANIRGVHRKNTFIENMYEVNFINELEDKIEKIEYDDIDDALNSSEKNILLIGCSSIKDSNDIYNLLNKMIYNYDLSVKYIDIEKEDTNLYNKVKEKIEDIGYNGAFSLPLVVIIESNNVIDYAIGNSKEEFFIDMFIENGVIKGDVTNE